MTRKGPFVVKSFVTIGSFDCDYYLEGYGHMLLMIKESIMGIKEDHK
jgi:hypothetical protein